MAGFSTTGLTGAGFTEAQATAITRTVQATANDAVDTLRDELARWHVYLALYLLIQIGIVLLAILIVQAVHEPSRSAFAAHADARKLSANGDSQ